MIDGILARKMNANTELGSRIDSVADLIFAICSAGSRKMSGRRWMR